MLSRMPGKPFSEQEITLLRRSYRAGDSNRAIGSGLDPGATGRH